MDERTPSIGMRRATAVLSAGRKLGATVREWPVWSDFGVSVGWLFLADCRR